MTKTATVQPLECCHADTCFPCYWSGHHLPHVGIPVFRGMTLAQIKQEIIDELRQGFVMGSDRDAELMRFDLIPAEDEPRADALTRRAYAAVRRMKPATKGRRRFFLDLEPQTEDDETVYAFFVFRQLEA